MSDLIDDHYEDVRAVINERNLLNMVETGTGPKSSGLRVAARLGLRGYSCDVYAPCVENARTVFPTARIWHAQSLDFLRELLPMLEGPTFFWLDGHCPTDTQVVPGPDFPPYEEIELIKARPGYERDVIWCDDIPMVDVPDNPHAVAWDVSLAGRRWQGAKEHTWAEYMSVLADTHTAEVVGPVLRYTPQ